MQAEDLALMAVQCRSQADALGMGPPTAASSKKSTDIRGLQTDTATDKNILDCLTELRSSVEFQELNHRVREKQLKCCVMLPTVVVLVGLMNLLQHVT